MNTYVRVLLGLLMAAFVPACNDDSDDGVAQSWQQVERLARPAVNEGLFVTNDILNTVNSITPAQEPGALVGAVLAEAVATLDGVDTLAGGNNVDPNDVVAAFIPDVMRIDTTIVSPGVAYSNMAVAFGTVVRPVAGRKITDDVIDITLTVLAGGAASDNVSYAGVAGNEAQPGHKPLLAAFPYLAAPN